MINILSTSHYQVLWIKNPCEPLTVEWENEQWYVNNGKLQIQCSINEIR